MFRYTICLIQLNQIFSDKALINALQNDGNTQRTINSYFNHNNLKLKIFKWEMYSIDFILDCMYLKIRIFSAFVGTFSVSYSPPPFFFFNLRDLEKDRKERTCICWFAPRMSAVARTEPERSWEPRTQCRSPVCMAGTQLLEPLLLLPRMCIVAGSWS